MYRIRNACNNLIIGVKVKGDDKPYLDGRRIGLKTFFASSEACQPFSGTNGRRTAKQFGRFEISTVDKDNSTSLLLLYIVAVVVYSVWREAEAPKSNHHPVECQN